MAETFATASVSITLTTITDMASFFVGILTPLKGIQIFCLYSGATIIFIYFYQLFMFGACLALSGYHEEDKRHGFAVWTKAIPPAEASNLKKIVFVNRSTWFIKLFINSLITHCL